MFDDTGTVTLRAPLKDIGGSSFYKGINLGERIRALEASGRVVYLDRDLDDAEIAALYRAGLASAGQPCQPIGGVG